MVPGNLEPGDKVRVKHNLVQDRVYDKLTLFPAMAKNRGRIMTISETTTTTSYRLDDGYFYSFNMLELPEVNP